MGYSVCYDGTDDCVILTVTGVVDMETIRVMAAEVAAKCEEMDCTHILNDMSNADIQVSFMDVFSSPSVIEASGIPSKTKRALVVPEDFSEREFLETVTRNAFHNLVVFTDLEKAKEWLSQE